MQLGHIGRDDMNAAVAGGQIAGGSAQCTGILAIQRAHQRALAVMGQRQAMRQIAIKHEGGHGAKDFNVVHQRIAIGVLRAQQHGLGAGGNGGVGIDQRIASAVIQRAGLGEQLAQALLHGVVLRTADERAHAHGFIARVAHGGFSQLRANGLGYAVIQSLGHQHAAYGRAFLAGFDGHLAGHFARQQGHGFAVCRMAGQQQRAVHAIGFDIAAHRMAGDGVVAANGGCSVG